MLSVVLQCLNINCTNLILAEFMKPNVNSRIVKHFTYYYIFLGILYNCIVFYTAVIVEKTWIMTSF